MRQLRIVAAQWALRFAVWTAPADTGIFQAADRALDEYTTLPCAYKMAA